MEAKIESQAHVPIHPRLLTELHEYNGDLRGFEQTARGFLTVHIGASYFLLPITMKDRLEKLRGEWIAVTLIRKKYYLRNMRGTPKISGISMPRTIIYMNQSIKIENVTTTTNPPPW
jgi:hypothetical protein